MDDKRLNQYYQILEDITRLTCVYDGFDREEFVKKLCEFAEMFRLSKGVTEFYTSPHMEKAGMGEIMVDYDNGKGGNPVVSIRIFPPSGVVLKGTLYMADDEEPLTDEERAKVELVYGEIMSFIARNRLQKKVNEFAFTDEDGFANRRSLMKYIHEVIESGQQYRYTAACINLKGYTAINQEVTRPVGDQILRKYYEYMQIELGDQGHICRLGGDNFVLFFRNELRDKMLEDFEGVTIVYDEVNHKSVKVCSRAGIYALTPEIKVYHPGQIMDHVYPAALIAKQRGLNVVFYDKEFIKMHERAIDVRKQFDVALSKNEIIPYYQPKVDIRTGKVVGAEALARWIQNDRIVPPMEFIPILEGSMDICRLDFHILEDVCEDIRRWLDEGREVPRISINLSRNHLSNPDLLGHILEIINRHEVQRKYLEIELTETSTDVEFTNLNRIVTGLKREGIHTSVDDFGSGFSSLNLIRAIPWDVVKIDRSLLPMDNESPEGITTRMYSHVASMSIDIGLECVTEGVETKKQVELLRNNNCMIAQGFYFDKPLPVGDFEKLLEGTPYSDKI